MFSVALLELSALLQVKIVNCLLWVTVYSALTHLGGCQCSTLPPLPGAFLHLADRLDLSCCVCPRETGGTAGDMVSLTNYCTTWHGPQIPDRSKPGWKPCYLSTPSN